jgi:SAM-dependent methyltransferase
MKTTQAIEANIRVHETLLAAGEYEQSPHRSRESKARVTSILSALDLSIGKTNTAHLDVGCGDGFIFECAPERWSKSGIDAAQGMLDSCQLKHPSVSLKRGIAEKIEHDSSKFDVVTCYSFLDHLEDRTSFYAEVYRVLKPGGLFYFGLSPNQLFSENIELIEYVEKGNLYSQEILKIERQKSLDNGSYYADRYGISNIDLELCEPGKTEFGGMKASKEITSLNTIGFTDLRVRYNWIMAQNSLGAEAVRILHESLPISSSAFKYFDLFGKKSDE